MEGTRLGRFEMESILGRGGMGAVYAARDTSSGERVALKVLSGSLAEDDQRFRRFEQEVAALSRLSHPNVVSILGPLERDGDRVFFPMELLEGETLSTRLRKEGPLPVPTALGVVRALLDVLTVAHDAGVIHRDIKPSNLFLAGERVVVTDFGLARMEDITRLTKTGQLMGSLDYMSPEQCEGEGIDHRTDLYSAGIVLYEMLVGVPPFRRESPGAVLKGHLTETPSRLDAIRADLPDGLSDVVAKLLAKNPDDRFPSAKAAHDALSVVPDPSVTVTFHAGAAPDSSPRGTTTMRAPKPRRRGLVLAVVAVLALTAAALALRPLLGRRSSPPYPGRGTREDLMETIHEAIRRADFETFSRCFDADLLDRHLSEPRADTFRTRAGTVTDFEFRLDRSRGPGMVSFRSLTSRALPTVLGLRTRGPLGLVIPPSESEYLVADFVTNPAGREPLSPSEMRRAKKEVNRVVSACFDDPVPHLAELLRRRTGAGKLTPEERERFVQAVRKRLGTEPLEYEIVESESMYWKDSASVVVRCPALGRALGGKRDRFPVEVRRDRRNGTWRLAPRRRPER